MRGRNRALAGCATLAMLIAVTIDGAAQNRANAPATRAEADADRWAAETESRMTDEERFSLLHGIMPLPVGDYVSAEARARWPVDVIPGAGYVPGVARLGIPSLRETDASLGVTNPFGVRPGDSATALPGSIALGASFNPELAYAAAKLVASEARAKGFNVLLGGGMNLMRDPRNGRNFEYLWEDPLVSGVLGGEAARGAQDAGVVSTIKHFSLNSNETNRNTWDAVIDEAAHRESDLLAFQIAIERGKPGSIMCAYNLVNGAKACGSDHLLNQVLKKDWRYKGWVMSDWGAVDGAQDAVNGLDQQSGSQLDKQVWFDARLQAKLADGTLSRARLSDMVRRILRSMKLAGITEQQPAPKIDLAAHAELAREVARQGIVLLKNDGVLPLSASAKSIAIIGDKAHVGVLSGGGSSQGLPPAGWAASNPIGGPGQMGDWRVERWFAGSPLAAMRKAVPGASVEFDPGLYPAAAAAIAKRADVAIVFVSKYEVEGFDSPDLSLPRGQDAMVEAVARANPNTIVVLQTGNPISMPWRDQVKGIVAAWYPGQEGAGAIADVLTGKFNPSGRLPITFPASEAQLPRPEIPSFGTPDRTPVRVEMNEGADVGYRWFARRELKPLYAFGHGLSYTKFDYDDFAVRRAGRGLSIAFQIRNAGKRAGADVAQVYLQSIDGRAEPRLLGFQRVMLQPGEARRITLSADPRLLAKYDADARSWRIAAGRYRVVLATAADAPLEAVELRLPDTMFVD